MTREEVTNVINLEIPDNIARKIKPEDVRAALYKTLDYIEALVSGDPLPDLEEIFRKIDDSYSKEQIDTMLSGVVGTPGENGVDGQTPEIGENGNWWIGGFDTGTRAEGVDGVNGENGETPEIGENENWWIGGVDTGKPSRGAAAATLRRIDYLSDIIGVVNNVNTIFQSSLPFKPGTIAVYKAGSRQAIGGANDFVLTGDNRTVQFVTAPVQGENLVFEYEILE